MESERASDNEAGAVKPLPERGKGVPSPDRRRFLAAAAGCVACALPGGPSARAASFRPIPVGNIADYPKDEISERFIQHDLFIVRHEGKIFASTAICPHKANALLRDPKAPRQIICSGHDSVFNPEGRPLRGQSRRPLGRHAITADEKGNLTVDTARTFGAAEWKDPASYVRVPAGG
ncbi:MAG: Rieske 2Fe-2S domain-containing protein [Verrucomicrobia bacterium]|nr:Rieske 2Fe-2S domain-containing protein [Verrucomicrobiota bacterium]